MTTPSNAVPTKPSVLKAVYLAPPTSSDSTQPQVPVQHTIQHELSTSLSSGTASNTTEKVAYLSELRTAVTALQGGINTYLTARMEEDNARSTTQAAKDESREEENYGEEVVEEGDD